MKKNILIVLAVLVYCLTVSCNKTKYLTHEKCYTCMPIVIDNEEYSDEEFGYYKEKMDSVFTSWKEEYPDDLSKTFSGYFRVVEVWKENDVIVVFLEDLSDPIGRAKHRQVISLADKPKYKGKAIKVGKTYYFELTPCFPVRVAPPFGIFVGESRAWSFLFENRWLFIEQICGDNIYSSVNLNGDKYIRTSKK